MSEVQVVKLGGELQVNPAVLDAIAAALAGAPHPAVVVHGGGPQATELQQRLGIEARLVGGRRITDGATLDVAKMVYAGRLNTDLVAALVRHGARAVGLTGADGRLVTATRRPPVEAVADGVRTMVDFGFVGDVERVDPALLHTLLAAAYTPVVCSLAADAAGSVLNVNADTVAAELAVALGARRLLVLTAVPGVFQDFPRREGLLGALTAEQARAAVDAGVAGAGMAPKLVACVRAVEGGVAEARILDGADAAAVAGALRGEPGVGTRIAA